MATIGIVKPFLSVLPCQASHLGAANIAQWLEGIFGMVGLPISEWHPAERCRNARLSNNMSRNWLLGISRPIGKLSFCL